MRFLTVPECEEPVLRVGIDRRALLEHKRLYALRNAADFFYKSRMSNARPVANELVGLLGDFTFALLWVHALPFGDGSRQENPREDWRRYAQWRRSAGEDRALYDVPGHLFDPNEGSKLAEAIEFAIYTGWDAFVFARPLRCVMALSHDDVIKIQSRHNLSSIAAGLRRLGLRQRDFHSPR